MLKGKGKFQMNNEYTVLARKYRSQDFASLIGQDVLVKTLTTAIKTGRIAHAYIFTGIRGTGKTSTARILAKALNCLSSDGPTDNPCGMCENCRAITAGQHIDVIEIDAASHTGVDNIRDILDASQYRPTNGRYKVYIIDEVHMLSTAAFNALLKTLEEPPAHVIFILATTEIRKVPVTILSRCQRFDLVRVPVETLKKHFAWIAGQEKIELSDAANEMIARAADGSVRDGLSLLDQAIAQTGGHVDEAAVLSMLKRADRGTVVDFMETILSGDTGSALEKLDEIYNNGTDLTMLLNDMMEWTHWATRIHPALRIGDAGTSPYTADQREKISQIDSRITLNTLSRLWQVMVASISEIQSVGNQKQCFDMLVVRMMHIADMPPISDMIKSGATTIKPAQAPATKQASTYKTISTTADLATGLQATKEILLYSYYTSNIEVCEISDGKMTYFDRGNNADFPHQIATWLENYTGKTWDIKIAKESCHVQTQTEHTQKELEADPLVASAMNLFTDAEVVDVSK